MSSNSDYRTKLGTDPGARRTGAHTTIDGGAATRSLFVIRGEPLGARLSPAATPLVIGRDAGADFQILAAEVSRQHCRLFREGDALWLEDLGSTNGTRVNGEPVTRVELADGDHVRIGPTLLKCVVDGSDEARYHVDMYENLVRDELTGLHNRRFVLDVLAQQVAQARRGGIGAFSVAMLDIDHFKAVNDRHGHVTGDLVLRRVAAILAERVRASDILARIGGEEFLVLLPDTPREGALRIAEDLRAAVELQCGVAPVQPREDDTAAVVAVTISIGVSTWTTEMQEPTNLLRAADERLYAAKAAGRNRVA